MDHHPRVLEQGIQPDAVLRHRGRQQLERALLAQDRDDAEEGRQVDDHDRRFLLLGAAPDEQADQRAPEAPQQERTLLARPERRDEEVERQVEARVGVDVGDVEAVLQEQRHQDRRRDDDAGREGRVDRARERQEVAASAVDGEVDTGRREAREERAPDRDHAGPDVHQLVVAGAAGCARVGLLDFRALVLGGALDEQLLGLDPAVLEAADRDDRDGVLEVAGPDAAVDDRHPMPRADPRARRKAPRGSCRSGRSPCRGRPSPGRRPGTCGPRRRTDRASASSERRSARSPRRRA